MKDTAFGIFAPSPCPCPLPDREQLCATVFLLQIQQSTFSFLGIELWQCIGLTVLLVAAILMAWVLTASGLLG